MANAFTKAWKYLMALFSSKVDEYADPKVQIQQAIEDAQRQHQALSQQAAAVIGNQRQLEMKLNRQLGEIEKLQASARQALVLADQARASGDEARRAAVRAVRAGVRLAAGHRRAVGGRPQDAARPVDPGRGAGQAGRRAQLDDAAAEDRRAHQAAQPAGAGEDAGAGGRLAAADERARRRRATPRRWRRSATRSSGATPTRSGRRSSRRTRCRAACSRCRSRRSTWPGQNRLEQIRASLHGTPVAGEVTAGQPAATQQSAAPAPADPADHAQQQPGTTDRTAVDAAHPRGVGGVRLSTARRERAVRAAAPCRGAGDGPGWHRGHQ